MKKIAFFYTTWTESGERFLKVAGLTGVELVPIHYSELVFEGEKGGWEVTFKKTPLFEFDLFYFRSVGDKNEALPILLEYAQIHKIPVVDEYLTKLGGAFRKKKSCEAMMILGEGISYPRSSFVADKEELAARVKAMEKPVVVKSTGGRHGISTFLVKSNEDLKKALLGRSAASFLIQEYIANDGDYRLFLVGYRVVAGFKRQKKEEKLVLNRSAGASVALDKVPEAVAQEGQKAARALGVEIAGIDCVIDKKTGQPVVIEVNQSPEFYTMERKTGKDIASKVVDYLAQKAR